MCFICRIQLQLTSELYKYKKSMAVQLLQIYTKIQAI